MSLRIPRHPHRLSAVLVAVLALGATAVPGVAEPVAARDGATLVSLVNEYRAAGGVAPVKLHSAVDQIAVERANQMARANTLAHNLEYVKKRLAQENVCWERLGEIIAWNERSEEERVARFVYQWYHSDGHRKIMMGPDYTHAGGSWTTGSSGRHYAAMLFVKVCGASSQPTQVTFTDIADSPFRSDILWLANEGITTGCTATKYCPLEVVSRVEMATFLRRAMSLPSSSRDWFWDDDAYRHEPSVNRVADAGITTGCGNGAYCPRASVTRAEMAAFLARALDLPRTSRDYFRDDDGMKLEGAINRIAAAGITTGCGSRSFCPTARVTREEMAAFIRRGWD